MSVTNWLIRFWRIQKKSAEGHIYRSYFQIDGLVNAQIY